MNQADFLNRLSTLAKFCGFTLTKEVVALYDKALSPHGYPKACNVLEQVIFNRRSRDPFPSIGDVLRLVVPFVDDVDTAIEAANRVVESVSRFGWCNEADAKAHIGEIGWYIVERNGGWVALCENMRTTEIGMLRAQFRELALAAIRRSNAGLLQSAPAFDERNALPTNVNKLIESATKRLGK
jgi:hypothetical protein